MANHFLTADGKHGSKRSVRVSLTPPVLSLLSEKYPHPSQEGVPEEAAEHALVWWISEGSENKDFCVLSRYEEGPEQKQDSGSFFSIEIDPVIDFLARSKIKETFQNAGRPLPSIVGVLNNFLPDLLLSFLQNSSLTKAQLTRKQKSLISRHEKKIKGLSEEEIKKAMETIALDPNSGSPIGNWNASVWKLGLEWGGGYKTEEGRAILNVDHDVTLDARLPFTGTYESFEILNTRYNQFLSAFYGTLLGWDLSYRNEPPWKLDDLLLEAIEKYRFLRPDGPVCSLNLYPFNRPTHDVWKELDLRVAGVDLGSAKEKLSIATAQAYHRFMLPYRKKAFAPKIAAVLEKRPLLIVSFGKNDRFEYSESVGSSPEDLKEPVNPDSEFPFYASRIQAPGTKHEGWHLALPFISSRWSQTINTPVKAKEYAEECQRFLTSQNFDIAVLKA